MQVSMETNGWLSKLLQTLISLNANISGTIKDTRMGDMSFFLPFYALSPRIRNVVVSLMVPVPPERSI